MLEDYQTQLEEISNTLGEMADNVEKLDKSELSATHKHYLEQAVKLIRMAGSSAEEAATWLELD